MGLAISLPLDAQLNLSQHGLSLDAFLGLSVASDPSSGAPPAQGGGGGAPTFAQTFHGGAGADAIVGGDGGDLFYGGGGSDSLTGGAGADQISAGSDTAGSGTSPSDMTVLQGMAGADTLYGGRGHDLLYGQTGNDVIVAGSGFETIYGGQGDDAIDARAVTAADHPLFISADIGNDFIYSGSSSEIVLGGQGDDIVRAGVAAGQAGTLQQIFGNQGNDLLSATTSGDASIYGGQGDDVISLAGSGGHLIGFGNLGEDVMVLQNSGTLFGGQASDTLYSAGAGSHLLSGDLGDDVLYAGSGAGPSAGGFDTLIGGGGSDDIHLSNPDLWVSAGGLGVGVTLNNAGAASLVYAAGDSSAAAPGAGAGGYEDVDRIFGFQHAATSSGAVTGGDQIHLAGLPSLVTPGLLSAGNVAVGPGVASGYAAAYAYAYGGSADGLSFSSHFGAGTAYVEVQVSGANAQGAGFYLFADDAAHTALFFADGVAGFGLTATLQTGDVIGG